MPLLGSPLFAEQVTDWPQWADYTAIRASSLCVVAAAAVLLPCAAALVPAPHPGGLTPPRQIPRAVVPDCGAGSRGMRR